MSGINSAAESPLEGAAKRKGMAGGRVPSA